MSSLGAIANGVGTTLLHRAADVTPQERRPLLLVARETPLNLVHLRNMCAATEAGAIIMPLCSGFLYRGVFHAGSHAAVYWPDDGSVAYSTSRFANAGKARKTEIIFLSLAHDMTGLHGT